MAGSRALGQMLRDGRKARGMTLRDVAGAINVSEGFVSSVEGGSKSPGAQKLVLWCQAVGVSPRKALRMAGHLSEAALQAADSAPTFADFVYADPDLTPDQARALITVYESYRSGVK